MSIENKRAHFVDGANRRAAMYLRVSTGRQAEHDLSIPDQRRQLISYCQGRGFEPVAEFVEPGASATDDRRPEFQRMMDEAQLRPARFDAIIVHSFSRFFRDQFQLEFYVRKLAKSGVRLISITQDLGDDPMSVMMRQIMALFDEYQSKENAKHTLRAMRENARQGFWNGSLPPFGYRTVVAEQRGGRVKKRLEPDPEAAESVRLIYRLAQFGACDEGAMGSRRIAEHLNELGIRTAGGGRWGAGAIHAILNRETYIGIHRFNVRSKRTGVKNAESDIVEIRVEPIIEKLQFDEVQALQRLRSPQFTPARFVNSPMLLGGIVFCAKCGAAMTLRTGKNGRYRYYSCSARARKGSFACEGNAVPAKTLDLAVIDALEARLLSADRVTDIFRLLVKALEETSRRAGDRLQRLKRQVSEASGRLERLYAAIETGSVDPADPDLKERVAELRRLRDLAQLEIDRSGDIKRSPPKISPTLVEAFASEARKRLRTARGGFSRQYVQSVAQRVDVSPDEIRITGDHASLMKSLAQTGQEKSGVLASAHDVLGFNPKWLPGPDSNRRPSD